MNRWWALAIVLLPLLGHAQEGTLNAVRQEVREGTAERHPSNKTSCDDTEVDVLEWLDLLSVLKIFTFQPNDDIPGYFVSYPYAEGWPGLMQISVNRNLIDGVTPFTWERLANLRVGIENGNDFHGINRLGVTFLADTMTRWGIGGGFHFYDEKLEGSSTDQLTLGDVNLLYRSLQQENLQCRLGLGIRFLESQGRVDSGVSLVYGTDYFPKAPWSFSMNLETGTLGDAWVFRATGRAGVVWKFSEAYIGYDYYRIGSVELSGPMVGLRFWF